MIDTHSHLFKEELKDFIPILLRSLDTVNLRKIILVAIDNSTKSEVISLARQHEVFCYSLGIHPTYVNANSNFDLDIFQLEEDIKSNHPIAIGECGLDLYHDKTYYDLQLKYFNAQIKLALKYNLPIIVHTRSCIEETYNVLKAYTGLRGVIHCYSGSYEMAVKFIKLGFFISFAGPLTYKNAVSLKEVARKIPLDKILVETDSPYLAPYPIRGATNHSLNTIYVLQELARLKELDYKFVEDQVDKNAIELFKLEVLYEKKNN